MIGEITNHLWQSTVFVAVVALVTLAFRRNRAEVRYWLWLSASLKFLIPFALLLSLGVRLWDALPSAKSSGIRASPSAISTTALQFTQPFPETFASAASASHSTNWLPFAILTIWGCGFLAIALMRFRGWLRIRAAIRSSIPLNISATVPVLSTASLLEPGVVGFLRPVLLLPEGVAKSLTPPQLEAILAHEQSHVHRRDNLTSALHMLVEAVFWFHPLVWWIGAKLVEERERACDEAVLARGNEPKVYAEGILNVCKSYLESPLRCVSGVTGSDLKKRIRTILSDSVAGDLNFARKLALAIAATSALALPILVGAIGAPTLRAQSQDAPAFGPEFRYETASIKPTKSDPGSHHTRMTDDEYVASNVSLISLIRAAYGIVEGPDVSDGRVSGAPTWALMEGFDVEAKMESSVADALKKLSREQRLLARQQMLQALLADRFGLRAHAENRELAVYILSVAKNGPKLQKANPGDTYDKAYKLPNGQPVGAGFHSDEEGKVTGQGVTTSGLVVWLSRQVGRTVVDKTRLTDKYDFTLTWTRDDLRGESGPDSAAPPDSSGPSIFMALQQQLGLKLESGKGPVKVVVVDHADRPSLN
jgi:bla regulator protein BlaR1